MPASHSPPTDQPPVHPELPPFVKLADPAAYLPCGLDLVGNKRARDYWVDFFCSHINTILDLGIEAEGGTSDARRRAQAVREEMVSHFRTFQNNHTAFGGVTILTLDVWRDQFLRKHGFSDCFRLQKASENEKMLPLLPAVIGELDRLDNDPPQQFKAAIEGVFAGNVFDMGAKSTAALFKDASPDFLATRDKLPSRPWRIDQFDSFVERQLARPYRRVVFFVDNAGSDFLLGAVPMIRLLARQGANVVITANEQPSLNDMTVEDVRQWWPRIVEAAGMHDYDIEIVSSGTGEPLIDLRGVSDELNRAATDADLVILEGMGRGVESNLDCKLTCDRLNLAMIKDELIAESIGGKVYDCVCRFEAGPRQTLGGAGPTIASTKGN